MFKKNQDDEWGIWDDDIETNPTPLKSNHTPKKKLFQRKKKEEKPPITEDTPLEELWDYSGEADYLNEDSGNVYEKEERKKLNKGKIFLCCFMALIITLVGIGYMNTDFDENNKAYVVNYDLHYERQYVKTSDELYDYCLKLKKDLVTIMPELSTNSLATTNKVKKIKETLVAKTNKVSRYTEVPQIMSTYNDNLISFSLSTQKMLDSMLENYTASDYIAWAESAYNDFSNSLETLQYLREQIDFVIYRNVYGGEINE